MRPGGHGGRRGRRTPERDAVAAAAGLGWVAGAGDVAVRGEGGEGALGEGVPAGAIDGELLVGALCEEGGTGGVREGDVYHSPPYSTAQRSKPVQCVSQSVMVMVV